MRHVLDLVPLYQHPDASVLVETLESLRVKPATFDGLTTEQTISEEGIPRYLTSIVSSPLHWILSEDEQEKIWTLASQRLAERSGRTAQPSFTRIFRIPLQDPSSPALEITLHEPSMTEDNLGLKTWASAYLLAKRLPSLVPQLFPPAQSSSTLRTPTASQQDSTATTNPPSPLPRILELGAGTGLAGLTLSLLLPSTTHLTDLPAITPNLAANIALNSPLLTAHQPLTSISSFPLDWADLPGSPVPEAQLYDVVLAADPLYSEEHPALLAGAVGAWLKRGKGARMVLEMPLREGFAGMRGELMVRLRGLGLVVLEEVVERGFDDWDGGGAEVECWWGVWGWGRGCREGGWIDVLKE